MIHNARRGAPPGAGPGARAPRAPWLIRPSVGELSMVMKFEFNKEDRGPNSQQIH